MTEEEEFDRDSLRDRFTRESEQALAKFTQDLLDNRVVTGAVGRAFEARERALAVSEAAMSAFNVPSASDIERLTRRLRSVSQRLEGLEDAVERLERRFDGQAGKEAGAGLAAVEKQVARLANEVGRLAAGLEAGPDPVPREQERLAVEQPSKPAAKPAARRRSTTAKKKT